MVEILHPLPESYRERAGQIYYEAFRRKFQPLVGRPEQLRRVLTAGFNLRLMLGACVEGELLGVAGLHSQAGNFSQLPFRACLRELGPVRGLFAWAVLNLFSMGSGCPRGELRLAALAVDAAARGQGVGSALLDAVCEKARREGLHAVRLEVVDTNTGAQRLYERMGFVVVKTQRYPIPPSWLGFTGDAVMVKSITQSTQFLARFPKSHLTGD